MKLYDKLPDSVNVNGKKIKLNLDFRNVLRMLDTLKRDDLIPEAREYIALKCICRRPCKGMMLEVKKLLFPTEQHKEEKDRITDYEQDAELIQAAFLQVYGINLFRDKLHWFEFMALLSSVPSGSKYSEILSIRARPLPTPNKWNAEERNWLIKAKAEHRIKIGEKEQEANYERNVKKVSQALAQFFQGR